MRIFSTGFLILIICLSFTISSNAQTVTATGSLNSMRYEHCSQVLSNGKVLVCGGQNGVVLSTEYYKSAELYDPTTGTWSYTGSMNIAREWFTSQILNNGNVLVMGGSNDPSLYTSCEVYDVASGTWSLVSSMLSATLDMSSVKLQDGRILVAGGEGNIKTQIYDPELDTWTYAGDMQMIHGAFMGMALLDDGNILATGGNDTPKNAEIFILSRQVWISLNAQTARNHAEHTITRLNTGKYLIVGTGYANTDDQLSAELYDPLTQTFSTTGNLLDNVGAARTTLLDDGRVLLYCLGIGGKPIQIYNPASGTWSGNNTFFYSGNHATVNMLHNGKILLSGGDYTVGVHASAYCYLVTQDVFTSCIYPSLSASVQGAPVCNGVAGAVTISTSESGINYQAWIGNRMVGNAAGTNGALSISIPENTLLPGYNVVNIKATKSGCEAKMLSDTAKIYVKLPSTPTPVITPSTPVQLCFGQYTTLTAPSNMSAYQWSLPGQTQQSISVGYSGFFRVRVRQGTDCYTRYSEPAQVTVATGDANAGADQSVCSGTAAFTLTGFSPTGGTWTGAGVSAAGVFDPALTGSGTFTLTYSSCTKTDTKIIKVEDPLHVPDFTVVASVDTGCFSGAIVQVLNPSANGYYEFMHNGTVLEGKWGGGTIPDVYTRAPGYVEKETVYTVRGIVRNGCSADTLIKQITVHQWIDPTVSVGTKKAKLCKNDIGYIYITRSQKGVMYRLTSGYELLDLVEGTGDTLVLGTGPLTKNKTFQVYISHKRVQCSYQVPTKITFEVGGPSPFFTAKSYNIELGNDIEIINNSVNTGGTYEWSFTAGAAISSYSGHTPPSLTYTTTGSKVITLNCIAPNGCINTLVKYIHVIDPVTNSCGAYSLTTGANDLQPSAIAYDKEGNFYQAFQRTKSTSIQYYSPRGDSLHLDSPDKQYYDFIHPIVKYNSKGILQWTTYIHNWNYEVISTITADSLGNSYYCFLSSNFNDSMRIYSSDGTFKVFNPDVEGRIAKVVVVKYNPDGLCLWYNSYFEKDSDGKIAVALDKQLNLYVSSQFASAKFDVLGNNVWRKDVGYADIEIDSKGDVWGVHPDGLVIDKFNSAGTILQTISEPKKITSGAKFLPAYLKLDEQNNVYVLSHFYESIIFNKDTFTNSFVNYNSAYNDLLLTKYNSNGTAAWAKQIVIHSPVFLNGMDYKKGQFLFSAQVAGSSNIIYNYNKNNKQFRDTLFILNDGSFIGGTDTTSVGKVKVIKMQEHILGSSNWWQYDLVRFSQKSDDVLIGITRATYSTLNQSFDVQQFSSVPTPTENAALIMVRRECLFPEIAPSTKFVIGPKKCVGTQVHFSDLSTGEPTNWSWTFEGGTPAVSDAENPIVVFSTAGTYSITLTPTNSTGTGVPLTQTIQIDEPPVFQVGPNTACGYVDVRLTASGNATYYYWNNSAWPSPVLDLQYLSSDKIIDVVGSTKGGCTTAMQHKLHMQVPDVRFSSPTFNVCLGETVPLPQPNLLGGIFSGDGVYNNTQFVSTGMYIGLKFPITYIYTDADGCRNSAAITPNIEFCPTTPTGVLNGNQISSITLYPNPCTDERVNLKYDRYAQGEQCSIQIYNAAGEIVLEKKNMLSEYEMTIDVHTLNAGLYQFVLHSENGEVFTSQIVIQ